MKMKIRTLAVLPFLATLAACAGGATYEQVTQARVGRISDMGAAIGRDATHRDPATVCGPGMVLVDANTRYRSETDSQYREEEGGRRSYRYRNAGTITPSNANGRLRIETRQEAQGNWTCEYLIPQEQQRRRR